MSLIVAASNHPTRQRPTTATRRQTTVAGVSKLGNLASEINLACEKAASIKALVGSEDDALEEARLCEMKLAVQVGTKRRKNRENMDGDMTRQLPGNGKRASVLPVFYR